MKIQISIVLPKGIPENISGRSSREIFKDYLMDSMVNRLPGDIMELFINKSTDGERTQCDGLMSIDHPLLGEDIL